MTFVVTTPAKRPASFPMQLALIVAAPDILILLLLPLIRRRRKTAKDQERETDTTEAEDENDFEL